MIRKYINSYKLARLYMKRGDNIRQIALRKYALGKVLRDDDPSKASCLFLEATSLFYASSRLYYKVTDIYNVLTVFHICVAVGISVLGFVLRLMWL